MFAPPHTPQTQQPWSWSSMDTVHVAIDTASTANNSFVLISEHGPLDAACDVIVDLDMVNMVQIVDEQNGRDNHEDRLQICAHDGDGQSQRQRHGHNLSLSLSGSQGHGHGPGPDAQPQDGVQENDDSRSDSSDSSVSLCSLSSHSAVSAASGSPSACSDSSSCLIESDVDSFSTPPPVPTDESIDSLFEEDAPSPTSPIDYRPGQPRLALRFNVLL